MTMTWPRGLLTALVTPLTDDEVNTDVVAKLINHQIKSGIVGFVVGGGTGEFGALSMDERKVLAVAAIDAAKGRVPVVIQTGTLNTRDAVELSKHAEASGATRSWWHRRSVSPSTGASDSTSTRCSPPRSVFR